MGHVLRHGDLLHEIKLEIKEGRMKGKLIKDRRLEMLDDMTMQHSSEQLKKIGCT